MTSGPAALEPGLRRAYAERDLSALEGLLAADVRWGDDGHPRDGRTLFQVHLVRAGRIAEICAFDDRDSAAAAGVPH